MNSEARNVNRTRSFLAAGILSVLFVGVGKGVLVRIGVDKDLCDLILMGPVLVVLFIFFKEPLGRGAVSIICLVVGIFTGLGYYYYNFLNTLIEISSTNGTFGIILYLFNSAFIIPFFEEKVVRQLLFFGLASHVSLWLSAILVSLVFGFTHQGNFLFAFLFSVVMCFLSYNKINTFNRSLLHGGFNLALNGMWIYAGLFWN